MWYVFRIILGRAWSFVFLCLVFLMLLGLFIAALCHLLGKG